MKVVCILQNAWGSYKLPLIFTPNELNKSAKTIRKKVLQDDDQMYFTNTTGTVTATASGKAKYDAKHFSRVIAGIGFADVFLVCGNQAREAVALHQKELEAYGKPIIYMPHPASRSLSNAQLAEVKKMIDAFRNKENMEPNFSRLEKSRYEMWVFFALLGANPVAADKYLNEHKATILKVAAELCRLINYQPTTVYRGVIMPEALEDLKLQPHQNFTYLSFSLKKAIAESFADHTETGFGTFFHLGTHGYLIEYQPKVEEVLYHHAFRKFINLDVLFLQQGWGVETLDEQEEVMVLQPAEPFTVIKYIK